MHQHLQRAASRQPGFDGRFWQFVSPTDVMRHALNLARRGLGSVEPNPTVGAVVVDDQLRLLGAGWHQKYGGPHAEVFALREAGERASGATLFVTLEPCCHHGKTPPCSRAVLAAGIRRVVVACSDPAPHVAGGGIDELRQAGVEVEVGLLECEARQLIAPFVSLVTRGRPWAHAKWAMTLDGKIAARTGHSQWISNPDSRTVVHQLRGRMDAIVVGIGTALADNPLLTARPPGPRMALRVVLDSRARLPLDSQLVRTAKEHPLLVVVTNRADADSVRALQATGAEVVTVAADESGHCANAEWLKDLAQRRLTNVLVEGGGSVLGSLWDDGLIDEVHAFVAPKLVGGSGASPIAGVGLAAISSHQTLRDVSVQRLSDDLLIHGFVAREHV